MAAKDVLGRRGEDLAARYLEQRGLVVLSRNWRCRHGELDLVATDADQRVTGSHTCAPLSISGSPKTVTRTNAA